MSVQMSPENLFQESRHLSKTNVAVWKGHMSQPEGALLDAGEDDLSIHKNDYNLLKQNRK